MVLVEHVKMTSEWNVEYETVLNPQRVSISRSLPDIHDTRPSVPRRNEMVEDKKDGSRLRTYSRCGRREDTLRSSSFMSDTYSIRSRWRNFSFHSCVVGTTPPHSPVIWGVVKPLRTVLSRWTGH